MDDVKTIRIRKTVLYLWIMVILVLLEFGFWSVARLGIWFNELWTYMTLGVMALAMLYIHARSNERAELEAMDIYDESKHKKKEIK